MEKEINIKLDINESDRNLIMNHSILNTLNVLAKAIVKLQNLIIDNKSFEPFILSIQNIIDELANKEKSINNFKNIGKLINSLFETIDIFLLSNQLKENIIANRYADNIKSIIEILKLLIQEILDRQGKEYEWVEFSKDLLEFIFFAFFGAVERNSGGKYKIVYNIAVKEDNSYMLSFNINSINDKKVIMPLIFQDIIRDVVANARKYSNIGSMILVGLNVNKDYIGFAVEDQGIGIPDDELDKVVNFRYRASNSLDKNTNGGGFGLTKAYMLTKEMGGRMWIKSEVNKGTRILIQIPRTS